MQVERSAASDGWSFSLRDGDGDSDSDDDQPALAPKPPPATELDRLIAAAEADGDDEPGGLQNNDEIVDIGAVDEGGLRFTETPFTISARLAANRKRNRALNDDCEAPRQRHSKGDQTPRALVKEPATRKPVGALVKGFQRQAQNIQSRPLSPSPKARVQRHISFRVAPAPSAPPRVLEVGEIGLSSDADEHDVMFVEAFKSKGENATAPKSAPVDKTSAQLRPPTRAVQPQPRTLQTSDPVYKAHSVGFRAPPAANSLPAKVGLDAPPPAIKFQPLRPFVPAVVNLAQSTPAREPSSMLPLTSDSDSSRSGGSRFSAPKPASTTCSSPPPPRSSPPPRAPLASSSFMSSPDIQSIVAPRLSLDHSARFSSDPADPGASFDSTHRIYRAQHSPSFGHQRPVSIPRGSIIPPYVSTSTGLPVARPGPPSPAPPFRYTLPTSSSPNFHLTAFATQPMSPITASRAVRPLIPMSPSSSKAPRRPAAPSPRPKPSPRRPPPSPPSRSTFTKNSTSASSHDGSSVTGPSATSATATRFILPGFAPAAGRRMPFRPKESLETFKARVESKDGSYEESELRFGTKVRSVKECGAAPRQGRAQTQDERRLQDLYRSF